MRVLKRGGEARIGLFSGTNSTIPTSVLRIMNESKQLIKKAGAELIRAKKIRKVTERSQAIGNIVILTK